MYWAMIRSARTKSRSSTQIHSDDALSEPTPPQTLVAAHVGLNPLDGEQPAHEVCLGLVQHHGDAFHASLRSARRFANHSSRFFSSRSKPRSTG
jgi:hypothetical protein